MHPDVLADMEARGLVHDSTDRVALGERLASGPTTFYWGCDPTADSLHIGSLVGLVALRRFQESGHRPIALAGGATGMVGDPSGRSDERNLLDDATLGANLAGIRAQLARFVDFDRGALLVDNATWTAPMGVLEFLRDVGKHVTVGTMLAKESVRARLASETGLSFTEFSYMLLQAHDYLWLFEHEGCELQLGGSDQWGNILAGIDLIRRRDGASAHGLTWPLLTRADGAKFGKTAEGTIWLSATRTSPFAFHQYLVQVPDADVGRLLLQLTLLSVEEAKAVAAEHATAPERRVGQRRLASEVTTLVHGAGAASAAEAAADLLFSGSDPSSAPVAAYEVLEREVPTLVLGRGALVEGVALAEVLAEVGLVGSRSEGRRALAGGGVQVSGRRADGEGAVISSADVRHGRFVLLRRGKRSHALLVLE